MKKIYKMKMILLEKIQQEKLCNFNYKSELNDVR